MTAALTHILRHPLKAIGREELQAAALTKGACLPWDRVWAVMHAKSKPAEGWMPKINFLRGVTEPGLMAVTSRLDTDGRRLTLTHPGAGEIVIDPDDPADAPLFLDWVGRIWPADLPAPTGIHRAGGVQFTDVPDPWISIGSLASLRALSQRMGQDLSPHRWRANLWIEGLAPWEEKDWTGRRLRIGSALLEVRQEITRCKATMANPETGRRDADTLGALRDLGHQEFAVYAEVIEGGRIATGDPVEVLA